MAKFSTCYRLCPLIDQKSFLGVTDESVNGCVIITLGKNMVVRYKLLDQKQVSSWSSKDKLSAPVVYDTVSQQYIGVFNANQISTWEDSCVQLNNSKKYKFSSPIDCVLTSPNSITPVVVFQSGHVLPLQEALDRRKEPPPEESPLPKGETISDAHLITLLGSVIVAIFTKNQKGEYHLHLIPLEEGLLGQLCLQRKPEDEVSLIGHALTTHESCQLLTLWSDGQLCSLELPSTPDSHQFPGRVLTTLTAISTRLQAAILPLSPSHLAIYGANASEEGAVLLIFNTQLCVTQCKQPFKLYTDLARLWAGGRDSVLVADAQYLVVVPFYLDKERLAALVGSLQYDAKPATVVDWGTSAEHRIKKEENTEQSSQLDKVVQSYLEEGMSQKMICQCLFLPTLDSKDVSGLNTLLATLTDVPEECIVSVISMCLEDINHPGYRELLRTAMSTPVNADLSTLRVLRQRLPLSSVLTLLSELMDMMLHTPADPHLIEWATLLLDAHCQQYLLSRDKAVTQTLTELKAVVDQQIEDMIVWQELAPLIEQLQNKHGLPDPSHQANTTYCIEKIKLY